MKKALALFALTLMCAAANAANYSFTVNDGSNIGRGFLHTNVNGFATKGSLVMTQGADAGTFSLFSGGSAPTLSLNNAFIFDNMIFENTASALDYWGLLFVGNGLEINIWGNGSGNPYSFWSHNGSSYNVASNGAGFNLNVQPVPVPAAVWLFGSSIAGLMGFSKRKKSSMKVLAV